MKRVSELKIHLKGYTMIIVASALFGTYGIWSKLMADQFGVFYQGWVRSLLIVAALTLIMVITKQFRKVQKQDIKWFSLVGFFAIFTQAPLYYAYAVTSVGIGTLLFYAAFIIASFIVGRFLIGERITRAKVAAMLLGFVGLVFIFGGSVAIFSVFGMSMAILNGLASGAELAASKKVTSKYPSILVLYYTWMAILVTHLAASLMTNEVQWLPSLNIAWFAMLAYSLAGLAASWLIFEGFKYVDASVGSLVGLSEIIWAVAFGAIFFGEKVGVVVGFGMVIVLFAGMLPDLVKFRRQSKPL